ncbi:LysR family transcriptional regulator [Burkholderia ubonensis]|uniref:LysR family transcriptional regulator n=1 Tax=Burkholderia ubonensis subsp. mesacidophila TaxID=265293 RepID=A0A2A4EM93_9BURK|nr:LysR family transcriptional regulator [Burkholderia ubonensis]PCE21512.1 LysR family transcriptional regulator [Burkholderia ubonensis subsp. mesacidophila]
MDTLRAMRIFIRVAEAGGFTEAARRWKFSVTSASRTVSALEASLRARLLERSTRRVLLTPVGERYMTRCKQILDCVDEAEAEAAGGGVHPAGKLKVHASPVLGQRYVMSLIARYRQRYPDVRVELTLTNGMPDLFGEGAGTALALHRNVPEPGLASRCLGQLFGIVCASRGYIETHGAPQLPQDLASHVCLGVTGPGLRPDEWVLAGPDGTETAVPVRPAFQVNVAETLAVGIREGMGIGVLPIGLAATGLRNGEYVRVMPDYRASVTNVYALYPPQRHRDDRIRTWIDFIEDAFPALLRADEQIVR